MLARYGDLDPAGAGMDLQTMGTTMPHCAVDPAGAGMDTCHDIVISWHAQEC